jgi:hypothetical protein
MKTRKAKGAKKEASAGKSRVKAAGRARGARAGTKRVSGPTLRRKTNRGQGARKAAVPNPSLGPIPEPPPDPTT